MKKTMILIVLLSVILAACSAAQGSTSSAASGTGKSSTNVTSSLNQSKSSSTLALELGLGTLQLEKTEYPIDAKQAAELLPLWKAARSLSKSDTTAAEEMTGLVKQIQETMTSDQLKAIQSMSLSMQDLPALAQELGLKVNYGGSSGNTVAGTVVQAGQAPPDGGGFPGGAGDPGAMGGMGPQGAQTTTGAQSSGSASFGMDSTLLDTVIQFLEAKVQ